MSTYENVKAKTAGMIKAYGQAVTLKHRSNSFYDPVDSSVYDDITEYEAFGLLKDVLSSEIDNTLIGKETKKLIVVFDGVSPTIDDEIVTDGNNYKIEIVKEKKAWGETLLYELYISL